MIAAPLLCLLLWDIGWALYMVHLQHEAFPVRSQIQKMESLITPLLTPVSFLLVFRLGRAAVRYWDARAALGKVVEICRSMSSTALVGCQSFSATCSPTGIDNTHQQQRLTQNQQKQQQLAEDFVRWIAVFPIAVKNFLRPHEGLGCKRQQEIGNVLCPEDCKGLLDAKADYQYAPIFVLNRMRQLAFEVCHPSLPEQQQQRKQQPSTNDAVLAMLYRQLNEQIDSLTGAWGAMERISGTPLPFVYVVHLRTFILLYLCLWHLEAIASKGWIALLPLMLASWGLLGIEAAAVECERPFQWQSNHLALGKACLIVSRNLAQTMQNTGWATNTNLTNKGN